MVSADIILNAIQTIGVIGALGFTGFEVYRSNRAQRFRNYLDHMTVFFDATKLLVENKDLHALYEYSPVDITAQSYDDLTADQKSRVHYCDILVGLCETVWVANQQRWLEDTEWPFIQNWIFQLGHSADFRWTVDWVCEDYSDDFMREVRQQVIRARADFKT
jgi:hypothetical protein